MAPWRSPRKRPGGEAGPALLQPHCQARGGVPWPPPLHAGDRLSRAEFETRYAAHPEILKAELLQGTVYMPSPARYNQHARPHNDICTWLGFFSAEIPGVVAANNATVRLGLESEVQPDALLRLETVFGGRCRLTEDDFLTGPPELVVEVAASSAAYDLHDKRRIYEESGVPEYLVLLAYEREAVWLALEEGLYRPLPPAEGGVLQSKKFPGLWLDAESLWEGSLAKVLDVLRQGMASPDHGRWVEGLRRRLEPASAGR